MKKLKNSRIILIFIAIMIILITIYGTYALWSYVSENNAKVNTLTYGLDYYINYAKGQDIFSSTLNLSSDYKGGNSATIELWKKDETYNIYGHIYLDVKSIGDKLKNEEALKWILVSNDTILSSGTLKGTNVNDIILLKENIPLLTTKQLFTVYIWLDENMGVVEDISDEILSVRVRAEATMKMINFD